MDITTIERMPTPEEINDFQNIGRGRKISKRDKFIQKLNLEMANAAKKGKPFAYQPALNEYDAKRKAEIDAQLAKYGAVMKDPDVEIDLSYYSDLKNFVMQPNDDPSLNYTGERYDEGLSKKYNKEVYLKFRVYRFKGAEFFKYTVMEPAYGAWDKELQKMSELPNSKQKI